MKFDAKEILEKYPKIKIKGKDTKLHLMGDDLLLISSSGRIERIVKAKVVQHIIASKNWFELEVGETQLIDEGIIK